MSYTLAEAAVACGVDKSTVRRAVHSGRISGTRDDVGIWHVEPVELHRVFPPVKRRGADTEDVPRAAVAQNGHDAALVTELRAVIADLRVDRDAWREQAQRLALPMPSPIASTVATPLPMPTYSPASQGREDQGKGENWWRRLIASAT